ncbi:NfeD family protein [Haloimpatiens sp. FM7330]|uniref:NfeD family protein n=1 Tax=Haloimpatiens sp. FM7330 TaxID=3298610 RepID=UPI0036282235
MDSFYLIIWLIIAVGALIIDITTSSFLFVWFTVGGIAAIISLILGYPFPIQLIIFIVISIIFMAIGYPIIKKNMKKTVPKIKTMEESYIGKEFVSDRELSEKGTIKISGIYWTVKNEGEYVKKGDKIKIIGIEGNKLVIKKIK